MALNLARLRGSVTKNKAALGLLGAAAVAALAWRARSTGATATTSAGATAAGTTVPAGTSATPSYYTSGGSSYDSTASDVYNAIQPQLESLQALFNQIPVPGTATTPAPAPQSLGYVSYTPDKATHGAWYELYDNNSKRWISAAEAGLKSIQPTVTLNDAEIAAYSKDYQAPA